MNSYSITKAITSYQTYPFIIIAKTLLSWRSLSQKLHNKSSTVKILLSTAIPIMELPNETLKWTNIYLSRGVFYFNSFLLESNQYIELILDAIGQIIVKV